MLLAVALTYLCLIGVTILTSRARIVVTTRVGADLMVRLRVRLFTHLQRLSLGFFTQEKAGVLFSRLTSDPMSLAQLFHGGLVQLAVQILTLVIVTGFILTLNVKLALILLLSVIPAMTVMTLWFRSASAHRFLAVRDRIADVLAHLQENLAGIRTVTSFNRNSLSAIEHRNIVGDYREANEATARVNALYGPGSEMVGILGQAILFFVGGHMVLQGELTVGDLAAFILYLTAFFSPIQQTRTALLGLPTGRRGRREIARIPCRRTRCGRKGRGNGSAGNSRSDHSGRSRLLLYQRASGSGESEPRDSSR